MSHIDIHLFATPGLGDATYMVASEGEAALIDPQRDAWRFLDAAHRRGWRIRHVLETHVHNDYVSGAQQVQAATGAEIVAPAAGRYRFPLHAADEGAAITIGNLSLVGMATPGHTPEHLCWQVVPAGATAPTAVLTGGSLLVGSAGRSDLLGPKMLPTLTADQFRSLRRLAALPDDVRILPTHGAGSFCVTGPVSTDRESTIGRERQRNPYLQAADSQAFRQLIEERLDRYPAYYDHMGEINRQGATLRDRHTAPPPKLAAEQLVQLVDHGVLVVDARDRKHFAEGHIPGAIHVEPTDHFASWVGAVVPFDAPLVLLVDSTDATLVPDLVLQLWRIGYEHVVGYVTGGIESWIDGGRPEERITTLSGKQFATELDGGDGRAVLDVRQPSEWREGAIPGSRMIFVGDLPGAVADLPHDRTWTVICKTGARASIAGSLLQRAGHQVQVVTEGGVSDVVARTSVR